MASIYQLKSAFQDLLRPLVRGCAALGISPNQITVAAIALSAAAGGAVAARPTDSWTLLALPPVLLARMALNAMDGMLAREHGLRSRLGQMLNEVGDVLSDALLYLPLALLPGVSGPAVVVIVLLGSVTELTGVVATQIGATRRYDGPMGKSDRALVFGALALALGLGVQPGAWLGIALWAVAALAALTVWHRASRALAEAGQ